MPGSMEVLDSKFAFSLKDFNKFQSETKVNQIIFSDHSFEADQNRTILGKRILLVSHEDSYTGAPLYLLQLANYLRNRGLEVIILCVRAKFKSGVFSSQGFKTVYIEDLSAEELLIRDWLLTDLGKTLVSDLILGLAPDQIWVNSINASCVIDLVDRLNITSCLFVHESFGFMSKNTLANEYEVMFRSSLEKAHLVVFGSEHSKSSFYQNEIRTNGIVLNSLRTNDSSVQNLSLEKRVSRRKEMGINPAAIVFLSMATFELRKRIGDIIDAFENSAPPNSYLILVGYVQEDRHSSHLKKRVDGKSNVLVFPVSKDPSYFYSISDVLVLASQSETYPLVLQEAIHWDLLRIVSKYPGYGASCNEETALMFEVGDLDQLKSLMTKSATHLQSSQLVKKAAKSDFSKKEEFYSDKLISILTNLSIVSVGLEDL
jgi:glycosyltransferase involved in cell wall biosynthesis